MKRLVAAYVHDEAADHITTQQFAIRTDLKRTVRSKTEEKILGMTQPKRWLDKNDRFLRTYPYGYTNANLQQ